MRTFEALKRCVSFSSPSLECERWTLYQARSSDFLPKGAVRDPADWGMSCIYRFDRGWAPGLIPRLLELTSEVGAQIARLGLERTITLVPYYEVGADFLAQAKPPYDGGYDTSRFGEFVSSGDCKPPPGFVLSHARLLDALIEGQDRIDAGGDARTELLRTVLHNSLIRPHAELFWGDDPQGAWTLFRPSVRDEDLES